MEPWIGSGDGVDGKVLCGHSWWLVPPQAGLVALWATRGLSPRWVISSPALGCAEAVAEAGTA